MPSFSSQTDPYDSPLAEFGEPQCQADPFYRAGPSRRLLYIAMVNCMEYDDELNAGQRTVPIIEILEGFMTHLADPTGGPEMGAIYLEPIRTLEIGAAENVVFREIIQLY